MAALAWVQGALTGCEDPTSLIALLEGGQLLAYDLTAITAPQQPAQQMPPAQPRALSEQRSGSPSRHTGAAAAAGAGVGKGATQQQHAAGVAPPLPPVQQLFKGHLQGQHLVTAGRLRMIPIQPVPLRGLQASIRECVVHPARIVAAHPVHPLLICAVATES